MHEQVKMVLGFARVKPDADMSIFFDTKFDPDTWHEVKMIWPDYLLIRCDRATKELHTIDGRLVQSPGDPVSMIFKYGDIRCQCFDMIFLCESGNRDFSWTDEDRQLMLDKFGKVGL